MTVATVPERPQHFQPALHDLTVTVHAPSSALSGHDGQIRAHGVQGVFYADRRALSLAVLRIDADEPSPVMYSHSPHGATFVGLVRHLGDEGSDPTVRVERVRRMVPDGMFEEIRIVSTAAAPVRATLTLDLGADLAPMELVRTGDTVTPTVTPTPAPTVARQQGEGLVWSADGTEVHVVGEGATIDAQAARLTWILDLAPRATVTLRWRVRVVTKAAVVTAACGPVEWARPQLIADDRRLVRLLDRALDDLESMRLAEPSAPQDTFLGAGVPWFLTLFGRDSILAARMLLPLGTRLAAGTLRVLARHQGQHIDDNSGEAPGKIMHELRHGSSSPFALRSDSGAIVYYGTVDATLLWINLLHEAWRWGMPTDQIVPLLPHLQSALGWLARHADPDNDGFLEYVDLSGRGLTNQGWKDSADAVRFRDGRLAAPPIALCEIQGYAYQAAINGAALLDGFNLDGAPEWRQYAADLSDRFRARFWVDGTDGPYPAMALDRDKRPVDALTSNIGHLLGTGLLTQEESELVMQRLTSPALSGGHGLRTMSSDSGGYNALSYHCGSIWPHDTAIVLTHLARCGFGTAAATLTEGLLTAAEAFDYQLPELYGGDDRETFQRPIPYPAACRPQAWSAAASVAILQTALGLYPDVPAGVVHLRPLPGSPLGAMNVRGLRVAEQPVDIAIQHNGEATITGLPATIRVANQTPPRIPPQTRHTPLESPTHPITG